MQKTLLLLCAACALVTLLQQCDCPLLTLCAWVGTALNRTQIPTMAYLMLISG
jgi:hypothetical protein